MSALRVSTPTDGVRLVDLGPCAWVPIYGTATMRGHAVASGRIARPDADPEPEPREPIHDERKRAVWAAATRRYRERRRVGA